MNNEKTTKRLASRWSYRVLIVAMIPLLIPVSVIVGVFMGVCLMGASFIDSWRDA